MILGVPRLEPNCFNSWLDSFYMDMGPRLHLGCSCNDSVEIDFILTVSGLSHIVTSILWFIESIIFKYIKRIIFWRTINCQEQLRVELS